MISLTLIIIPAEQLAAANEQARQMQFAIDGTNNGANSFRSPLFTVTALNDSTPVAYWLSTVLSSPNRTAVGQMQSTFGADITDYNPVTQPTIPTQRLAALGYRTAKPTPLT